MWSLYLVMRGLGPRTHEGVCGFKMEKLVGDRAKPGHDEKRKIGTTAMCDPI
jgi:hypothetical protein